MIGLFSGSISLSSSVYSVLRSLVGVGFLYGFCFIAIEVRKKKEICVIYRSVCLFVVCLKNTDIYLKNFFLKKGNHFKFQRDNTFFNCV